MVEKRSEARLRAQKMKLFGSPLDPRAVLTDENKAVLSYFAFETARYIQMGIGRRLEDMEERVNELSSREIRPEEAKAVREIFLLFSRYKLFRILRSLSKLSSENREFTKNSLIRAARVGQSFRREGLDRLIEILSSGGLLVESGRRGRGPVFRVTGEGRRFLQTFLPRSSSSVISWNQ